MLSEDTKVLEFNQYQKSDKTPYFIYANIESLLEKIDGCKKFIESTRFMPTSSSNIVNNLVEKTHQFKCKYLHDNKT